MKLLSVLSGVCALALMCCAGCSDNVGMGNNVFSCDNYTVTSDSIVQGTAVIKVTPNGGLVSGDGDELWVADSVPGGSVVVISDNAMLDAVFGMSLSLQDNVRVPHLDSYVAYLSGVFTNPDTVRHRLMDMVKAGRIQNYSDSTFRLPTTSDKAMWINAAWDVYKVTGDKDWLKDVYPIAERALSEDLRACMDARTGLLHGLTGYLVAERDRYMPEWIGYADMYDMYSLSANVSYATACNVMDSIATVLDVPVDMEYGKLSRRIARAVNDRFWIPNLSFYSGCLYGGVFPIQLQSADNLGQSLAVISGIASHGIGSALVKNTPVTVMGTPLMFPLSVRDVDFYETHLWSVTQAYWNIASARAGNVDALTCGVAAMLRGAVFNMGRFDYSSVPAVVIRGIAGMDFTTTGIRFLPCVPEKLVTYITINGLKYREALLDIHISGCGMRIKSFAIDGKVVSSSFFPSDLTGHHSVDIVMDSESLVNDGPLMVESQIMPSVPDVVWNGHEAMITNYVAGEDYEIYLNGVMEEALPNSSFGLYDTTSFAVAGIVPILSDRWFGWSSLPYYFVPESSITQIFATDFGRKSRHSTDSIGFVDMSSWRNSHAEFIYAAPRASKYLIDVACVPDSVDGYALAMLEVNGRNKGMFVLGGKAVSDTACVYSNMIMVEMDEGANSVALNCDKFINYSVPRECNTAHVRSVRIIQQ